MKNQGFAGDVSFTRGKCKPGVPCRHFYGDEVSVNDVDCHVRQWLSMVSQNAYFRDRCRVEPHRRAGKFDIIFGASGRRLKR